MGAPGGPPAQTITAPLTTATASGTPGRCPSRSPGTGRAGASQHDGGAGGRICTVSRSLLPGWGQAVGCPLLAGPGQGLLALGGAVQVAEDGDRGGFGLQVVMDGLPRIGGGHPRVEEAPESQAVRVGGHDASSRLLRWAIRSSPMSAV